MEEGDFVEGGKRKVSIKKIGIISAIVLAVLLCVYFFSMPKGSEEQGDNSLAVTLEETKGKLNGKSWTAYRFRCAKEDFGKILYKSFTKELKPSTDIQFFQAKYKNANESFLPYEPLKMYMATLNDGIEIYIAYSEEEQAIYRVSLHENPEKKGQQEGLLRKYFERLAKVLDSEISENEIEKITIDIRRAGKSKEEAGYDPHNSNKVRSARKNNRKYQHIAFGEGHSEMYHIYPGGNGLAFPFAIGEFKSNHKKLKYSNAKYLQLTEFDNSISYGDYNIYDESSGGDNYSTHIVEDNRGKRLLQNINMSVVGQKTEAGERLMLEGMIQAVRATDTSISDSEARKLIEGNKTVKRDGYHYVQFRKNGVQYYIENNGEVKDHEIQSKTYINIQFLGGEDQTNQNATSSDREKEIQEAEKKRKEEEKQQPGYQRNQIDNIDKRVGALVNDNAYKNRKQEKLEDGKTKVTIQLEKNITLQYVQKYTYAESLVITFTHNGNYSKSDIALMAKHIEKFIAMVERHYSTKDILEKSFTERIESGGAETGTSEVYILNEMEYRFKATSKSIEYTLIPE